MADENAYDDENGTKKRRQKPSEPKKTKKKRKEMDEETYQGLVKEAISDAVRYIDEDIAPEREAATYAYRAEKLDPKEELTGQSTIVMSEVRDVVLAMLPSLLRIFLSPERAVEFLPTTEDHIEQAAQQTDYVNHIIQNDNPGFEILYGWMKDALIRKTGVVKFYREERESIVERELEGLDPEQLAILMDDPDIDITEVEEDEDDPNTGIEVRYTKRTKENEFRVQLVPPEEFLIARNARDMDSAELVAHRQLLSVSDLVAMGYDRDEVLEHAGGEEGFELNSEATARNPALDQLAGKDTEPDTADPATRKVLYTEAYIRADRDGDGIAELRRVCVLGNSAYILHDEMWDDLIPFALLCPDPEPHMVIGNSIADQTLDLQKIKTNIMRSTLDSLAQSVTPRTGVVENLVNMDDVLNTEVGGVIRMRAPGAVQNLDTPFVGQQALGVLDYVDSIAAKRTGITKASQGLDPDVLQSTTKAAVTATMSAAQERIEMIARIFAETGFRRLFKGLLRLVCRYQDKERIVRLRGKFVKIDPRDWDADMQVIVNVGLGTGNVSDRMLALTTLAQKQELAVMQMPGNPLFGLRELRNTYATLLEMADIRDVTRFMRPLPDNWEQMEAQMAQQGQNGGGQDAALQAMSAVEMAKVKQEEEASRRKHELELEKLRQQQDLERDRMESDIMLKVYEMQLKYGAQVDIAQIKALVDRDRAQQQAMASVGAPAPQAPATRQPQPQPQPGGFPPRAVN